MSQKAQVLFVPLISSSAALRGSIVLRQALELASSLAGTTLEAQVFTNVSEEQLQRSIEQHEGERPLPLVSYAKSSLAYPNNQAVDEPVDMIAKLSKVRYALRLFPFALELLRIVKQVQPQVLVFFADGEEVRADLLTAIYATRFSSCKQVLLFSPPLSGSPLERRVMQKLAMVVCYSQQDATLFRETIGLDDTKLAVIPECIDFSVYQGATIQAAPERLKFSPGSFVLACLGELDDERHATILRAVARVAGKIPRLVVLIIGQGEAKEALRNQARNLGVESIVKFSEQQFSIPQALAGAHLVMIPRGDLNGKSSALESMANYRPVLAAQELEHLTHWSKEQGITYYDANDVTSLAEVLVRLAHDTQIRRELGQNGRQYVESRHDAVVNVSLWREVFMGVLEAQSLKSNPA